MDKEYEKKKLYFELVREGIKDKFSTLLYVSSLTAALLVIGSFNDNLFPLNNLVRVILSALLILMVLCLWVYLNETTKMTRSAYGKLSEITGHNDLYTPLTFWGSIKFLLFADENGKKSDKKFSERFASQLPHYAVTFLWIVVITLIFLIWINAGIKNNRHRDFNYDSEYNHKIWKN